jgi:hypothetical protein
LAEAIRGISRPRYLTFEEGPLADWLFRHLGPYVDEVLVCEPRRNQLIAKDSEKDDPIDAEKLAQLYRGHYLKRVHHPERLERAIFKQHVAAYHDAVRLRVARANRILAQFRRHGVFLKEADFARQEGRATSFARLPASQLLRAHRRESVEAESVQRACGGVPRVALTLGLRPRGPGRE